MSTGAQPLPHRMHWPHRWVVGVVTAGVAVGIDRAFDAVGATGIAVRDARAIFPDADEVVAEAEPELPLRNH